MQTPSYYHVYAEAITSPFTKLMNQWSALQQIERKFIHIITIIRSIDKPNAFEVIRSNRKNPPMRWSGLLRKRWNKKFSLYSKSTHGAICFIIKIIIMVKAFGTTWKYIYEDWHTRKVKRYLPFYNNFININIKVRQHKNISSIL
jgi:hypothetical protein